MVLGISLLLVGSLGMVGLAAVLMTSTSQGTIEFGALATLSPRMAAVAAVGMALGAGTLALAGAQVVLRERARRGLAVHMDERARAAEEEARARLLEFRLEQLEREVEGLEIRRAGALGELHAPSDPADEEPRLVLVPDVAETTELSRRLASAPPKTGTTQA